MNIKQIVRKFFTSHPILSYLFLKIPLEERNGMGVEARKRIVNLFDEKFVIDAYLRVLNEIEH